MTQQTEAQRLAAALDALLGYRGINADVGKAAAELRRLDQHELANNVWHEKTEWVQNTVQPHELGMHRADVLRQRIDRLEAVNAQLLEALELALRSHGVLLLSDPPLDAWRAYGVEFKARAAIAAAKGKA
jgi:hypothetical protein